MTSDEQVSQHSTDAGQNGAIGGLGGGAILAGGPGGLGGPGGQQTLYRCGWLLCRARHRILREHEWRRAGLGRSGDTRCAMAVRRRENALRIVDIEDDTVLSLEPLQGLWTEEQYLAMTDNSRRLLEFDDGVIEVLPMPIPEHQKILAYLYRQFFTVIEALGGVVLFAPLRIRVRPRKFREPDLVVLLDANDPRQEERYWLGVDVAVEVVSADDPERDTKIKRKDYAQAGIPEYWIVNPLNATITVLILDGNSYIEHGVFHRGDRAASKLLSGFAVSVDEVFGRK